MKIEYEAKFTGYTKLQLRKILKVGGAKMVRKEFKQKRVVFEFPKGNDIYGGFVRVRDEGDRVTLTVKIINGDKISDQKETMVTVNDFDSTASILKTIGCIPQVYEETLRELWSMNNVEITIDTWPFLGTILEIEGRSEKEVKKVSEKLGFDWSKARFCAPGTLYKEKYGHGPIDVAKKKGKMINNTFDVPNPFIL